MADQEAIVLCANNPWDGVQMADVHLATAISEITPVLYVDPPTSHIAAMRKRRLGQLVSEPRLQMVAPTIARLTPLSVPGMERPVIVSATSVLMRRQIRSSMAALRVRARVLIACSPLVRVFGSCDEQLRVFWVQDDYVGGARLMGLSPARIARGEERIALDADVLVASSPVVAESWRRRGFEPLMVPFGCDAEAYSSVGSLPPPNDLQLPHPVATFVGHINDRIDVSLLESVTKEGISLLLVGPCDPRFEPRLSGLLRRPHVQWVGRRPAEELGRYMQVTDVALVPYVDSAFNRGSFPLKTLEYLAAGLPVVATDLPSIRWFDSDLISVASTPEEFAAEVGRWSRSAKNAALIAARRRFARGHTWQVRAKSLIDALANYLGEGVDGRVAEPASKIGHPLNK